MTHTIPPRSNRKDRTSVVLRTMLSLAILAVGAYACLHPAAARKSVDKLTQFVRQAVAVNAPGSASNQAVAPLANHAGAPSIKSSPSSWGARIAAGHAFAKHGAALGCGTRAELAALIDRVIANPSASRSLSRGRSAYWYDATGIVVICDPSTTDGGTAFKPDRGRGYYEGLR